jgi:G2/mitotic-specific cyclin 2
MLIEKLNEPGFSRLYVCKKYAHKKFLKASTYAVGWAQACARGEVLTGDGMALEQ